MHHNYMIAISALFLLVFAIMIHSMAQHRRTSGQTSTRFAGPTGTSQWIWVTIPLLILGLVNVALFRGADRPEPAKTQEVQVNAAVPQKSATMMVNAPSRAATDARQTRVVLAPQQWVLR